MEIPGRVATKIHQIRFDDTRTTTGTNRAVWRTRPTFIFVLVDCAYCQDVDTVGWYLHSSVARCSITVAIVADRYSYEGVAVAEQVINNRGPNTDLDAVAALFANVVSFWLELG